RGIRSSKSDAADPPPRPPFGALVIPARPPRTFAPLAESLRWRPHSARSNVTKTRGSTSTSKRSRGRTARRSERSESERRDSSPPHSPVLTRGHNHEAAYSSVGDDLALSMKGDHDREKAEREGTPPRARWPRRPGKPWTRATSTWPANRAGEVAHE